MDNQNLILRVDLSTEKISKEPVPEELRRKYLGGEGINAYLLWKHFLHIDPRIDPLSPDNVLIIGMGPLGSTGVGSGSKTKFTYKSPAYNIYGDTSVGGWLGTQLRWSGYDHVVITGRAKRPVYLWVNDDNVEIRDASHLWGQGTEETDKAIRQESGEDDASIAYIGQAGENLVRVASIIAERNRAGARGGGGCVFGSKNLKAIAAWGTKGLPIHDPEAFFNVVDEFVALRGKGSPAYKIDTEMRYGTLAIIRRQHDNGWYNTFRNGQGNIMPDEGIEVQDHNWYTKNLAVRALACSAGCMFGCGGWYHIKGNESPAAKKYAGEWGTKPEYGAANPFGTACDIRDMPAICHLTKICNDFGMDTMEVGMSVSLLMELWERGIIDGDDTSRWCGEPLSLEWGNHESVEKILRAIGLQNNLLGEILRGGVYQAAVRISELKGVDVLKYASYGKGKATHEGPVRANSALTVACALAPIGAHHTKSLPLSAGAMQMFLGKWDAADASNTALKGTGHAVSEPLAAIYNSLGLCHVFWRDPDVIPLNLVTGALEAVTGFQLTVEELQKAGERVANIEKAFNSRLGLRRKDDSVCYRWMDEPHPEGTSKGLMGRMYLEAAKDEYYAWRGWDKETSLQTRKKLKELDMLDVAQVLEREKAIV